MEVCSQAPSQKANYKSQKSPRIETPCLWHPQKISDQQLALHKDQEGQHCCQIDVLYPILVDHQHGNHKEHQNQVNPKLKRENEVIRQKVTSSEEKEDSQKYIYLMCM